MRCFLQATIEESSSIRAVLFGHVDQDFVVQSQDDLRIEGSAPGPHQYSPGLKELGGCPLNHRIAPVAASCSSL